MNLSKRELVGYCGLYCGDCFAHNGVIADLAKDLRKELRAARFADTAEVLASVPIFKAFAGYPQCYDVLGAIVRFRCKRACRGGGGDPRCPIRLCCEGKNLAGCWLCDEFGACAKLRVLERLHGDAALRNLRVIKRRGVGAFIKGKRHWHARRAT